MHSASVRRLRHVLLTEVHLRRIHLPDQIRRVSSFTPYLLIHDVIGPTVLLYLCIYYLPRDASAERGDATVSCLSVRPSVRNI